MTLHVVSMLTVLGGAMWRIPSDPLCTHEPYTIFILHCHEREYFVLILV